MASVKQVTLRMTTEEWKAIKNYATNKDQSINDLVMELLSAEVGLNQKEGK